VRGAPPARHDPPVTNLAPWSASNLEAVCIALTSGPGLTNTEIGNLLAQRKIKDVDLSPPNKWTRLYNALAHQQNLDEKSNRLVLFINDAMAPGRFLEKPSRFEDLREQLNRALALVAYKVNDQGQVVHARLARTLDEVAKLTGRLQVELARRGVHSEVIRYCEEKLLRKSLFHAVFEATKGLSERLRRLSGSALDGDLLVAHCFGISAGTLPVIRINDLRTESDKSEQKGFASLLRGVYGTFRNPPAHAPRITADWSISEADALDLFSMLSLFHRRLDTATVTPRP
jgi:uncharacterized protein (TIGR02391 family)